jgi:DNA-binding transcriptional MocR family regulator
VDENIIWEIRAFVYQHFAERTRPPSVDETAIRFGLTHEQVVSAYEELHRRHTLYLQPGTHEIRMANPFSGVETPFRVRAKGKTYFANCAWDTFGIPATLHVDADIEAACSETEDPIQLSVRDGQVQESDAVVHFLVPFREWYNDLTFT